MDTYLDRLELQGFKSFPDKTVIKFHKGLTAVIGPNGCGKSNIVDSILWVMGEQKIKNLRGENNEDLIFNGSSTKKPLGMTEVGAYFLDQGEETFIARRFYRSGESKYMLNERYCRNRDIQDILFKLRLGGTNYFIFEQGSIEKLVSLKPAEKRVLIEEAADISKYLVRKKETVNKLIISAQNLDNIQILINDKEHRLKDLRNQVNYVQRYRTVKTDKVDHLRTLLKTKYDAFQTDFQKYRAEIEKILNHEGNMSRAIGLLEKSLLKVEEKRWLIDKDLKLNQQKTFDYNKKLISTKNDVNRSKENRSFKGQRIGDIKNTITSNTQDIAYIEKNLSQSGSGIKELEAKLKEEKSGYEGYEEQLVDLNDKLEDTNTENAGLKSEIFDVQGQLTRITNQIKDIDKRMMRIENQVETKKNFVTQLQNQVSAGEITETKKKITELTAGLGDKEKGFAEAETLYAANKKSIEDLGSRSKNYRNEIRNLENQKNKYLEIKRKIVGKTVDMSGIPHHGYLQDLLEADKKYHQLLENFYYEEMDAVLMEGHDATDTGGLNKCLLKRKVTQQDTIPENISEAEGFLSLVHDVYSLKESELKGCFKNGVLVDNLKNALQLFVAHGIDVVTMDAETITKNGLLIRNRDRGILDVLEEIREIDEKKSLMEKDAETVTADLEKEKEKQPQLSRNLENLRRELREGEKKLLQLKTLLDSLEKNRDTNMKRITFTESEIQMLEEEKDKLQDQFEVIDLRQSELEDAFGLLEERRERFREEVQRLKEDINRVEKQYLQKENTINLVKEKINSSNSNIKNLEANRIKLEKANQNGQREAVKLEKEIERLKAGEEGLGLELKELNRLKDECEELSKKQEADFNRYNGEIKKSTTELNEKRRDLEQVKDEHNRLEINISSIKKDLVQLEDIAFKELNEELRNLEALPELKEMPLAELEEKVDVLNERMIKMRDSNRLNFSAEAEFELLTKDYNFLLTQKEDVVKSIEDMNDAIKKIDDESKVSFTAAFNSVKENFEKNFQILFEGGEAELSLMEPDNILETGLEIKAQPPGKRLLSLKLLSGGEKTLTSLAFLFALFEYKPSPFCVFDEVDASLDEANIQRFLKFLHKLKEKTQFLIITHNFKTMEEADYLYGISMNEPGISTVYSMKMSGKGKFERADGGDK
ncbi:MAG: chromosome segregation protein SMC [bacterium]|nr:chromosome segregation protein SMC [bacterium]